MLVYRVAARKFAMDLTGEGARIAGGRWNPKGMAVLYTAEHSALALLEIMAHLDRSCAPVGLQLATIAIPDNIEILSPSLEHLPGDWDARPKKTSSVLFGRKWLQDAGVPVLKVPSIMTPYGEGWNLLLNPSHPELLGKMSVTVRDWMVDSRLFATEHLGKNRLATELTKLDPAEERSLAEEGMEPDGNPGLAKPRGRI